MHNCLFFRRSSSAQLLSEFRHQFSPCSYLLTLLSLSALERMRQLDPWQPLHTDTMFWLTLRLLFCSGFFLCLYTFSLSLQFHAEPIISQLWKQQGFKANCICLDLTINPCFIHKEHSSRCFDLRGINVRCDIWRESINQALDFDTGCLFNYNDK